MKNKNKNMTFISLQKFDRISYINKSLNKKYFINNTIYGKYIIESLLYEEKNKYVSRFKEYLIIDETAEFFKRYYNFKESLERLTKFFNFYTKYSKLFPNYIPLIESKYIYKNIHKKQNIIDLQLNETQIKENQQYIMKNNESKNNTIFNSEILESIAKNTENFKSSIFGIDINETNEKSDNSFIEYENIINSISKYELESKNKNKEKNIVKYGKNLKNIIINNYYYNNSSVLTKQNTISLINSYQQKSYINEKMFSFLSCYILLGLKKRRKKSNLKNNINSSKTFKNLKSCCLIKKNDNKNRNCNNKYKHTSKDTNSLSNTSKNKRIKFKINKSLNYLFNNKINYSNNNIIYYNLSKNNIKKCKKIIPYISKVEPSQNKKLMKGLTRLYNIKYNKYHTNMLSNKSSFNNSNKYIKINKKKKLNHSFLKKMFFNKTKCLTDRTLNYVNKSNNKQIAKKSKNSENITLKQISNNTSRNNSDNSKAKNFIKYINKNKKIYSRKKNNRLDKSLYNRFHGNNKKYYLSNLTTINLSFHKNININSGNSKKSINNKKQLENYNAKTEREYLTKKQLKEFNIKKVIKIQNYFHNKISKLQKNQNQKNHIKSNNRIILRNNNEFLSDKSNATNSIIIKGNTTIDNKDKVNLKNSNNFIDKYKIKKNLFKYNNLNITLSLYNNLCSTDSSLSNSNNELKKNIRHKTSSEEREKNQKNYINIIDKSDKNIYYDNNIINNFKKPSVIKIKGIKIKNFNKIVNKEKSNSNSSKKNRKLIKESKKNLLKIPKKYKIKNLQLINHNIKKIKNLNIKVQKNNNVINSFFNNLTNSLTERNNL